MMKEEKKNQSWCNGAMLKTAFRDALRKFDPRALSKNFVIFVTAIGALVATVVLIRDAAAGSLSALPCKSRSGSGSPSCSPTLRKHWRKAVERPRRTL